MTDKELNENKIEELKKYKMMWGELKVRTNNLSLINRIEEEYFPTFKRIITFKIEAPSKEYLRTAINDFEIFWCNYTNRVEGRCAKFSYGEE
jgi:hypothetical protein